MDTRITPSPSSASASYYSEWSTGSDGQSSSPDSAATASCASERRWRTERRRYDIARFTGSHHDFGKFVTGIFAFSILGALHSAISITRAFTGVETPAYCLFVSRALKLNGSDV